MLRKRRSTEGVREPDVRVRFFKQIHTFATGNINVLATTFRSGLPRPLSSRRLGQPRPKRRCSNNMLLVNVWVCLMIMISQQEPSLKQGAGFCSWICLLHACIRQTAVATTCSAKTHDVGESDFFHQQFEARNTQTTV